MEPESEWSSWVCLTTNIWGDDGERFSVAEKWQGASYLKYTLNDENMNKNKITFLGTTLKMMKIFLKLSEREDGLPTRNNNQTKIELFIH